MRAGFALVAMLLAAPAAHARPVLVELFTSQACSSCPPADALLQSLAAEDKSILPLSLNVTYWNAPAWTDADSMQAATDRQYWYAGLRHSTEVYTPEAVVDGATQVVGSDRGAVTTAIAQARAHPAGDVKIALSGGATLTLAINPGTGQANILLFGYDPKHVTHIGGGENGGAVITEVNVVRSLSAIGVWHGAALTLHLPRPPGAHAAVVLQTDDGAVLGVAAN